MINNSFFILYFTIIFFLWVYFWFSTMTLHRYVANNAGELYLTIEANCRWGFNKLPWRYGTAILRQHTNITFYSSLERNCRQIVNYSLLSRKKTLKIYYRGKMPPGEPLHPENCLQGIGLPFRKFKLYLRPNIIGWIIRPRNVEELQGKFGT